MKELIYLYDNALIYYSNVFFPVLFLLFIVGSMALYHITILVNKKIISYIEKLKTYVEKKKIKKTSRTKIRFPLKNIIKNILFIIMLIFIYVEAKIEKKTEKIIKRIEKEILIDKNS